MANEWYVQAEGKECGPFSDQELRALAAKRQISQFTSVRKGTTGSWLLASRIRGLFELAKVSSVQAAPAIIQVEQTNAPSIAQPIKVTTRAALSEGNAPDNKRRQLINCPDCGKSISPNAASCPNCGHAFFRPNRSVAIALAWLLGGIGVHKFYLRRPGEGIVAMLFCWTFIPALLAFIEGFQYLSMDDATFAHKFGSGKSEGTTIYSTTLRSAVADDYNAFLAPGVPILKTVGKWTLAIFGGLLILVMPVAIVQEPHQWMTAVLYGIAGTCMLPFGWKLLSNRLEFVEQYGTVMRWVVGLFAIMLAPAFAGVTPSGSGRNTGTPTIPVYSVVKTESFNGNKKGLVVRLDKPVTEDVLRAIATELKNTKAPAYDVTQIAFYLPGMKVGAGAWAMADFNPNLKIRMIGLSVEKQQAIAALPQSSSRQVIGSWWDERPMLHNKMSFYRENGKVFMENKFSDGKARVIRMSEQTTSRGRKFTNVPDDGDFYLVNASGDLEWWDADGHFLTSRKAD